MDKLERLQRIIDEETEARKEAYFGYCEEIRYEWGDNAKVMTFEEWEREFEELGGWKNYF